MVHIPAGKNVGEKFFGRANPDIGLGKGYKE